MFSFGLHDPPPQRAPPSSLAPVDDEAQKRNTDCVYFLASPLTCKKGSNCEYRHSEEARMNPRDCYYWLYKTCLNPNCSFRHPPLEGKVATTPGPQASNIVEPVSVPSAFGASTTGANKSTKPCYFFSQGYCSKAEKCPFLHAPPTQSTIDTGSQQQKTFKASHENVAQVNNKGESASKVDSSAPRPHNPVEKKPLGGMQLQLVSQNMNSRVVEASKAPTDSGLHQITGRSPTSAPSRSEKRGTGTNKLQKTQLVAIASNSAQVKVNGSRQSSSILRPKKKLESDVKLESIPSSISRAEVQMKNSSVRLDSNDPDQREDGEYSPPQDGRGRMRRYDDTSGFVHRPHAGSEHVPSQQHHEQHQLQQADHSYDQGTLEQTRPHKFISSKVRTRDSQKFSLNEYSDTGDLREHLTKRRRNVRGDCLDSENLAKRDNRDTWTHLNMLGKETFKKPSRNIGVKRPHASSGSVSDSVHGFRSSPARASSRNSPKADHSRKESKVKDRDPNSSAVLPAPDARAHLSSKIKKPHIIKEKSEFAGPKSLAQIKAERMVKSETVTKASEKSGIRISQDPKRVKFGEAKSVVSTKNFGGLTDAVSRVEKAKYSTSPPQKGVITVPNRDDFEGPKPLSLLLKEKRRVESNDVAKEVIEVIKDENEEPVELSREFEDGEVQDEQEECKYQESHDIDIESMTAIQRDSLSRSPSEANEESAYQGESDAQDDIESSDDRLKLDLESGENAYGDDEYVLDDDDDDDEDDFAKKLGGFFS